MLNCQDCDYDFDFDNDYNYDDEAADVVVRVDNSPASMIKLTDVPLESSLQTALLMSTRAQEYES